MYLNMFSVRVPEGKEKETGYVELKHKTQYTINLKNDRDVRCDAEVFVDGKHVGTFRLGAKETLKLERPVEDDGRFTFYKTNNKEAKECDVDDISVDNRGLIQVTFKPEIKSTWIPTFWTYYTGPWKPIEPPNPWHPPYKPLWCDNTSTTLGGGTVNTYACNVSVRGMASQPSAGITGLSGQSNQKFYEVANLNYDTEQITTINLRLIAVKKERKDPRPLIGTIKSTPIPPPVFIL